MPTGEKTKELWRNKKYREMMIEKHGKIFVKKIKCVCKYCNKDFFKLPGQLKNNKNGKFCSKICHLNFTKSETFCKSRMNENNPNWKGNKKITYTAIHHWVKNHKPPSKFCEICKINPPRDLANISQQYKRDVNDFKWLCRRCHMIEDGRMKNLKQNILIKAKIEEHLLHTHSLKYK